MARMVCAALLVMGTAMPAMASTASASGQQAVTLQGTHGHTLRSKLNGAEYQLTIVMPEGYETGPERRYPALYVMDGNRWARLLAVLLPRFATRNALPPFIVVGIDYDNPAERYQDYGPVSQRYYLMDPNRGAAKFMRVIKEEIIPFVDANYRTDPTDRGIGGHSMGGLFTAYALLRESQTFQRFWISSPSLFYDDEIVFKDFADFAAQRLSKTLYVFMDVGEEELPSMRGRLERFDQRLVEAQPDKVVSRLLIVPDTNHMTVVPGVFAPALEHLYRYRPQIVPAAANLVRFVGDYELPDGRVITLVTDGRQLLYQESNIEFQAAGDLLRLLASAPNRFYRRGDGMEIEFDEGKQVPRLMRIRAAEWEPWIEARRLPDTKPKREPQPTQVGRP